MKEQTLSRRTVLRAALLAGCSLWMPIALAAEDAKKGSGSSSAATTKKVTQASVKYQPKPKGDQKCAECAHFIEESGSCKLVEGKISPAGWCTLWAKKA